jgi:hypothetical protein
MAPDHQGWGEDTWPGVLYQKKVMKVSKLDSYCSTTRSLSGYKEGAEVNWPNSYSPSLTTQASSVCIYESDRSYFPLTLQMKH